MNSDILSELRFGGEAALPCRFTEPKSDLNARYHNMADVIATLRNRRTRSFRSLNHVHTIQDLFDPSRTADLISFIALGGLDALVDILSDDALFRSVTTPTEARIARVVLTDLVRLLDEAMIVNGNISWYLLMNYPQFIYRVLSLMALEKVRDKCFSMMEHIISFVGPVWNVNQSEAVKNFLLAASSSTSSSSSSSAAANGELSDVTFCRAARVLSICVVPAVVAGPGTEPDTSEPFPQTLDRMRRLYDIAAANAVLLSHPYVLKRLVGLLAYSRDTRRNNNNARPGSSSSTTNRTGNNNNNNNNNNSSGGGGLEPRTVIDPVTGQQARGFELTGETLQQLMAQTTGSTGGIADVISMLSVLASGGGGGGGRPNNNPFSTAASAVGPNGERVLSFDFSGGGGGGAAAAAVAQFFGRRGDGDGEEEEEDDDGDNNEEDDNEAAMMAMAFDAAADVRTGDMTSDDNAMLFSRFLNDLNVENAIDEDGTVDDTADCPWFVGDPDAERNWRLRNLQIDETTARPEWTESSRAIVKTIQKLAPTDEESGKDVKKEPKTNYERKIIVSGQSEVLYLLNSLMTGVLCARVWFLMDDLKANESLFEMLRWFVEVQPTVNKSNNNNNNSNAPPPSSPATTPSLPPLDFDFDFVEEADNEQQRLQRCMMHIVGREERRRNLLLKQEYRSRASLSDQLQSSIERLFCWEQEREEENQSEAGTIMCSKIKKKTSSSSSFSVQQSIAIRKKEEEEDVGDEHDDSASVATSHEADRSGHQHNVDTLCRIELIRLIHEFWDARTCEDSWHVARSHVVVAKVPKSCEGDGDGNDDDDDGDDDVTTSSSSSSSSSSLRSKLLRLLVKYIVTGTDDPCVDNLACFAIEACVRGMCVVDRLPTQRYIASKVIFPVLDRLLLRSPRGIALLRQNDIKVTGPLPPLDGHTVGHRRIDASFTVVGDSCRHAPQLWAVVEHWVNERDALPFVRDRLLRCTQQMALFVRGFLCTRFQDACCPVALATSGSAGGSGDWKNIPGREQVCEQSASTIEPSYAITERVYFVRKLLAERDLTLLSASELFELLETAPSGLKNAQDEASSKRWFSSSSAKTRMSCAPDLTESGQRKVDALVQERSMESNRGRRAKMLQQHCPELFALMDSLTVPLLARLFTSAVVEDVETIDRLNVTCTLIFLGGLEHERGLGEVERVIFAALDHHKLRREKLIAKRRYYLLKYSKKTRKQNHQHHLDNNSSRTNQKIRQNNNNLLFERGVYEEDLSPLESDPVLAAHYSVPPHACNSDADDDSDLEADDEKLQDVCAPGCGGGDDHHQHQHCYTEFRRCLNCGAARSTRNRVLRLPCAGRAFFNALCVWIAHYARHPEYFHSLYFTTQFDVEFFVGTIRHVLPILKRAMTERK